MRVGVDVAPLVLDNAGTARYVDGLLGGLAARDDVQVRRLSWGGAGRVTAAVRDVAWYPVGLPLQARGLDVLHCTTFRAPLRARVPVVVTVHDLAVVRHPELFTAWTRAYARTLLLPVLRAADVGAGGLRVHEARGRGAGRSRPGADRRRLQRRLDRRVPSRRPVHRRRLRPRRRDARAAQEPRTARRRDSSAGVELRVAGVPRMGHRRRRRSARALARPTRRRRARGVAARGALPCLSLALRGLRDPRAGGDALRRAGRHQCGERDGGGRRRRSRARRSARERVDRAGIERAIARRDELRAAGFERARRFSWKATAAAATAVYAEAAAR